MRLEELWNHVTTKCADKTEQLTFIKAQEIKFEKFEDVIEVAKYEIETLRHSIRP